ncbi:vesicle transport through interaction with t-SNAREs homolog 1A isoform X1 [Macaca thibetana thibetana]|uniref:vesicle transport through interaction with t-SNAREs homolog 1A isoform X1 n=1 Tax=Macaca thibetana thibetana TaxID=257877 RepID=UPI0021BCECDC|nr:vesicle transport through interaction with t-SNAREs homolog 1A isoform X1 [Macaca thibetana thibetana]
MSSDFEGYEQDFAVLTAEITSKIARVPRLPPDEKKQMVANVEKQLEEAKELLEQMDLEVREIPPQSRGMYSNRMRSYKQEMGKLETDFKRSRIAYSDEVRNELLGDDGNSSENQLIKLREERAHLLDNTERLERSSRRLEAGYQIAVETEQIGQEMLENLSHDREKIQRARERLRETDANLGKSSRILTGMLRRMPSGYPEPCLLKMAVHRKPLLSVLNLVLHVVVYTEIQTHSGSRNSFIETSSLSSSK